MIPVRLRPGDDLRGALQALVADRGLEAAFVVAGIGSLAPTRLRFAGEPDPRDIAGDVEILTLSGSVSPSASHLHASVADAAGRVLGGHVGPGCIVRTTAEILIAPLPDWRFTRAPDPVSGYDELVVEPRA